MAKYSRLEVLTAMKQIGVIPVFYNADFDVVKVCNSRKIPYSPDCGSVTEIHKAEILGVEICKIFPGSEVGGPAFVKSVKGPCPWTEIMPTGESRLRKKISVRGSMQAPRVSECART